MTEEENKRKNKNQKQNKNFILLCFAWRCIVNTVSCRGGLGLVDTEQ